MNAEAKRCGGIEIVMHRHGRAEFPGEGCEALQQRAPLRDRQILLAQAEPATAAVEERGGDLLERALRLIAIGDDENRRAREPQRQAHPPTRPSWGLDGSACVRFGMRPASRAPRPASTARRIASAMRTGSRALATAVLSSTPSQPNSIACAASEAVPMPASRITGTALVATMRSIA